MVNKRCHCKKRILITHIDPPRVDPHVNPDHIDEEKKCDNLIPRYTIEYILKQGSKLTRDELRQIEENYQSNNETRGWFQRSMMTNPHYWFTLAVMKKEGESDRIIGQGGINKDKYELSDDVIGKDWQGMGVYKCLIKARVDFVKTDINLNDRTYYLFTDRLDENDINVTQKEINKRKNLRKIQNHVDSGLTKLDRDINYDDIDVVDNIYTSPFLKVNSTDHIKIAIRFREKLIAFYINPPESVPDYIDVDDSNVTDPICTGLIARSIIKYVLKQGSHLSETERLQIENNYKNNTESDDNWYNATNMINDDYWFVLAIKTGGDDPTNVIIGQMGIDKNSYELRDECVNKTYEDRNLLKCLFTSRAKYIRDTAELNDRIYYYFADKRNEQDSTDGETNKLNNLNIIREQLEAGLVQLDHDVNGNDSDISPTGKYVTSFPKTGEPGNVEFTISPTERLLAFRTPGYYTDSSRHNYVSGSSRNYIKYFGKGVCSGLYLGNGLIMTAGHCHLDHWEPFERYIDINSVEFPGKTIHINSEDRGRVFFDHPERTWENRDTAQAKSWYIDLAIIDISNYMDQVPRDLEKIIICENPSSIPIHTDLMAWGRNETHPRTNLFKGVTNNSAIIRNFNMAALPDILLTEPSHLRTEMTAVNEFNRLITGSCATNNDGTRLRQGDSGGPLLYVNQNKQTILIGSLGQAGAAGFINCPPDSSHRFVPPSAFTNISPNLAWVRTRLSEALNEATHNNKIPTINYVTGTINLL